MAWVKMVPESEATGFLKELYEHRGGHGSGVVSEVVKVLSLRPELMDVRVRFGDAMTFGGSGLGRFREEIIATSISAMCKCRY